MRPWDRHASRVSFREKRRGQSVHGSCWGLDEEGETRFEARNSAEEDVHRVHACNVCRLPRSTIICLFRACNHNSSALFFLSCAAIFSSSRNPSPANLGYTMLRDPLPRKAYRGAAIISLDYAIIVGAGCLRSSWNHSLPSQSSRVSFIASTSRRLESRLYLEPGLRMFRGVSLEV